MPEFFVWMIETKVPRPTKPSEELLPGEEPDVSLTEQYSRQNERIANPTRFAGLAIPFHQCCLHGEQLQLIDVMFPSPIRWIYKSRQAYLSSYYY